MVGLDADMALARGSVPKITGGDMGQPRTPEVTSFVRHGTNHYTTASIFTRFLLKFGPRLSPERVI